MSLLNHLLTRNKKIKKRGKENDDFKRIQGKSMDMCVHQMLFCFLKVQIHIHVAYFAISQSKNPLKEFRDMSFLFLEM